MDRNNKFTNTYEDSGYNRFLIRSIASNSGSRVLSDMSRARSQVSSLNFDNLQVSGSLGDTITVGRIELDGVNGVIDLKARDVDDVVVRVGELDG